MLREHNGTDSKGRSLASIKLSFVVWLEDKISPLYAL